MKLDGAVCTAKQAVRKMDDLAGDVIGTSIILGATAIFAGVFLVGFTIMYIVETKWISQLALVRK